MRRFDPIYAGSRRYPTVAYRDFDAVVDLSVSRMPGPRNTWTDQAGPLDTTRTPSVRTAAIGLVYASSFAVKPFTSGFYPASTSEWTRHMADIERDLADLDEKMAAVWQDYKRLPDLERQNARFLYEKQLRDDAVDAMRYALMGMPAAPAQFDPFDDHRIFADDVVEYKVRHLFGDGVAVAGGAGGAGGNAQIVLGGGNGAVGAVPAADPIAITHAYGTCMCGGTLLHVAPPSTVWCDTCFATIDAVDILTCARCTAVQAELEDKQRNWVEQARVATAATGTAGNVQVHLLDKINAALQDLIQRHRPEPPFEI